MKPSHPISRSTSVRFSPRLHLNTFRGVRAISKFDWPFTYPQVIRKLFNAYRFGPPDSFTCPSTCPRVDHLVSRPPPLTPTPCSDSLSLRLRTSLSLTLPTTVTRRFIMQKARRHGTKPLRPLVGIWFQGLLHSSVRGSFHLSLTVLVRYRSLVSI